ncbi:MAG: hypothetical protein JWO78_2266 [Micavibrio sp.]|nr:hypothetical protein [Micavibrio sp.]
MNTEEKWMNDVIAGLTFPAHSAGLHDRIMARVNNDNVLFFGFRRPNFNVMGLKISGLAFAAMLAGFYVGTLGTSLPASNTTLAYNDAPYYIGSGMTMAGMLGGQ